MFFPSFFFKFFSFFSSDTRLQQRVENIFNNELEPIVRNQIYPSQEQPQQPEMPPSNEEVEGEQEEEQQLSLNSPPQPSTSYEVQPLNRHSSPISDNKNNKKEPQICPICLDKIIMTVTPCYHTFHPHCLQRWTEQKENCPICRKDLPESFL